MHGMVGKQGVAAPVGSRLVCQPALLYMPAFASLCKRQPPIIHASTCCIYTPVLIVACVHIMFAYHACIHIMLAFISCLHSVLIHAST
jgi:hypothetical protein